MAIFVGFDGWLDGIRGYIDADDYTDEQVEVFLALAQRRLNRDLASVAMEATAAITALAASPHNLPSDFGKIRQVSIRGVGIYDVQSKADYIEAEAAGDTTSRFYAIDADKLWIWPEPGAGAKITIDYYVEVPSLSPSTDSTIFTRSHPDLLLYAACLEASAYMVEDERIGVWQSKYDSGIALDNEMHKRIKQGSTPLMRKIP